MRWDKQLWDAPPAEPTLPLAGQGAVVRQFDTPGFRGCTFYEVKAKSILNHVRGGNYGFSWTLNPYRGCSHACSYCFARPTHTYLDLNAGRDFETKIVVKANAPAVLARELRRPSWTGEKIAMGTNTDNYQRAEGRYRLMRGILRELNAVRNPYSILTKSTLIRRDLDLLQQGAAVTEVSTAFSIGTVDEQVWRRSEPGTPHPRKRLEVLGELNRAGIPCGVLMAPILPGMSDSPDQLAATVEACASAGATHITPLILHLRPGVKEEFTAWMEVEYPDLIGPYRRMYRGSYARKEVSDPILQSVYSLRDRHPKPAPTKKSHQPAPAREEEPEQLVLEFG